MLASELETFKRLLEKFPSACGKPHSLLTSLRTDAKCGLSVVAARWVQKLISDGFLESEVEEKYKARFIDAKCYEIDIKDAPVRGNPEAKVTIVEFSDFECPHCRMAEPWLKQVLDEFPKDVKLVFMNYPLPNHPNAQSAAAAAVAAGKQKKFWAYHDKLFDNQDKLRLPDLVRYAEELKLDVERFKADLEAARTAVVRGARRVVAAHGEHAADAFARPFLASAATTRIVWNADLHGQEHAREGRRALRSRLHSKQARPMPEPGMREESGTLGPSRHFDRRVASGERSGLLRKLVDGARRGATSAWCSSISTCCLRARCGTTLRCRWSSPA